MSRRWSCAVIAAVVCALVPGLAAAERPKVVVLNLAGSDPSLQRVAETMSESLLTELGRSGKVEAIGPGDLAAVMGLERQKAMLGCTADATNCFAEVSAAMGAPFVVTGALQKLGKTLRVDLKLIQAKDGKAVYRDGRNIKDESDTFDVVAQMVKDLLASPSFAAASAGPVAGTSAVAPEPSTPSNPLPWVVVGVGAAAAIVGGVLSAQAGIRWSNLHSDPWRAQNDWKTIQSETQAYNGNVVAGPVLAAVGVAAIAGGLWWRATAAPGSDAKASGTTVSLAVGPGGFVVGGTW